MNYPLKSIDEDSNAQTLPLCEASCNSEAVTSVLGKLRIFSFCVGLNVQGFSLGALAWVIRENMMHQSEGFFATSGNVLITTVCWLALVSWPMVWLAPFLMSITDIGRCLPSGVAHFGFCGDRLIPSLYLLLIYRSQMGRIEIQCPTLPTRILFGRHQCVFWLGDWEFCGHAGH